MAAVVAVAVVVGPVSAEKRGLVFRRNLRVIAPLVAAAAAAREGGIQRVGHPGGNLRVYVVINREVPDFASVGQSHVVGDEVEILLISHRRQFHPSGDRVRLDVRNGAGTRRRSRRRFLGHD